MSNGEERRTMTVAGILEQVRDTITVKRVFGEAYASDGCLVVPVAAVRGGGGGGDGADAGGNGGSGSGSRRARWASTGSGAGGRLAAGLRPDSRRRARRDHRHRGAAGAALDPAGPGPTLGDSAAPGLEQHHRGRGGQVEAGDARFHGDGEAQRGRRRAGPGPGRGAPLRRRGSGPAAGRCPRGTRLRERRPPGAVRRGRGPVRRATGRAKCRPALPRTATGCQGSRSPGGDHRGGFRSGGDSHYGIRGSPGGWAGRGALRARGRGWPGGRRRRPGAAREGQHRGRGRRRGQSRRTPPGSPPRAGRAGRGGGRAPGSSARARMAAGSGVAASLTAAPKRRACFRAWNPSSTTWEGSRRALW